MYEGFILLCVLQAQSCAQGTLTELFPTEEACEEAVNEKAAALMALLQEQELIARLATRCEKKSAA